MSPPTSQKETFKPGITTKDLENEIKNYEKRWLSILEEIKKEPIAPEEFYRIIGVYTGDIKDTAKHILVYAEQPANRRLNYSFQLATNNVTAHLAKAGVLSASKWKDKHPSILSQLFSIVPKKIDINAFKVAEK